ncbi:MAG: class I SAM-dependent methyltransferase [Verrucomicrobiota bacterium]
MSATDPPLIIDYVAEAILGQLDDKPMRHLDISAGWGHLIRRLNESRPNWESEACDFELMPELGDIPGKTANLNTEDLPFPDNTFDLVTCTEAFEHIENYHRVVREVQRILKPGGIFFVSVPNMLSLRSRWIFATRGLFLFYDALPTAQDMGKDAWMRHISPITFFHLGLSMLDNGLEDVQHYPGKVQKFSAAFYWLASPIAKWASANAKNRRDRKGRSISAVSDALAAQHHSWNVMTSRTLIASARKPK